MDAFLKKLMDAAKAAGIEACEAYLVEEESFRARSTEGEINEYQNHTTRGLGFRGLKNGRMGYASTEAFDEDAVSQLVKGVLESAELCEDDDPAFLYEGRDEVPRLRLCGDDLASVTTEEKLDRIAQLEKAVKGFDKRVEKTARNVLSTGRVTVRIVNSYGMDRSYTEDLCALYGQATARVGKKVATGFYGTASRDFEQLNASVLGTEIARRAIDGLDAKSLPSGRYHVVLNNETMVDLLGTFSGIFSAENAQKGLSLLKGRLGEAVAASCITLVDDPLLLAGTGARPFDDEGVASKAHTVIENGVFRTFLHNLKTARKDGVQTTGNAQKASYAAPVCVEPSNLYLQAGKQRFEELLASVGEGVVITEVSGLHAGANPVSGDFSLLSKGYVIENGKRGQSVEQITVAGNFYELLKNARSMADDLIFPMGSIGSPSVDVGELSISGC